MVYNRTGYAPWSLTREAGVQSATVDGTIEVPQYIQPVLDTGFVDINGNWKGVRSSDETFTIDTAHENTPNSAAVLVPQKQPDRIDMTGYKDLFIAILTSQTGNCAIDAVMGPDTNNFANLTPVNSGTALRGSLPTASATGGNVMNLIFNDNAEALTGDVWNIFPIYASLAGQKNLQFKITNNSGSTADITFAYLRVV